MTVSEVLFIPTRIGKCNSCNRENQQLGNCNAIPTEDEDGFLTPDGERCIDCFFGVPSEYE